MITLPPLAPVTGWRASTRLARDYYVRLDGNDYSVHPAAIGRRVAVRADLERVQVHCEGRPVADHQRVWAWHQSITDPEHHAAAVALQRQRLRPLPPPAQTAVEVRALADYDTALGIEMDGDRPVAGGWVS